MRRVTRAREGRSGGGAEARTLIGRYRVHYRSSAIEPQLVRSRGVTVDRRRGVLRFEPNKDLREPGTPIPLDVIDHVEDVATGKVVYRGGNDTQGSSRDSL